LNGKLNKEAKRLGEIVNKLDRKQTRSEELQKTMKEEWKERTTQFQDIYLRFLIRLLPLMGSILIP